MTDLQAELTRELCPVSAPDSLWAAIHEQRRPLRVRPNPWATWSLAAAALLVLLAGLVWRLGATRDPRQDLEVLAAQELRNLANGSEQLDVKSSDPHEIQRWVKAKLDIDVSTDTPSVPEGEEDESARLLGARLVRTGTSLAAVIAYRVGPNSGAVVVAGKAPQSSGQPQRPCLFCHSPSAALVGIR